MKKTTFKKALSAMLSSLMLLPALTAFPVSVSAASSSTVIPMSDYGTAAKALAIYQTTDVPGGVPHSWGENVGVYGFDAKENALSIKKASNTYCGGYYRFHLKLSAGNAIAANESWLVVTYKTNADEKASMNLVSNGNTDDTVTLAEDISVSNGEWVCSAPVNIDTKYDNNLMDRLLGGNHDALSITLSENTDSSVYFYIKNFAFFSDEASAKNFIEHGVLPQESLDADGSSDLSGTGEVKGTSSFVGGYYTHGDVTIPTSLWVPKSYSPDKEYALLIYFHNVGGRGATPTWSSGNGNALTSNIIKNYGEEFIIFAPRCPSEYRWAEADWATGMYDYANTPTSKPMSAVLSFIYDELFVKYSIDKTRIYAAGDSMGGGGTWDLILRAPDLLAAALPVAGYNDPSQAANIREDLKLWIVHTAQDKSVNVAGDRATYAILKNLGRDVRYTEYDSSNPEHKVLFKESWNSSTNWEHWAWVPAYEDMEMVNWLANQKKDSTPAEKVSKFEDVPVTDPYFRAIDYVTGAGLFNGTSETTFSPTDTMTRSMFVTVLGRLAGVDVSKYTEPTFTDVAAGQWYTPYVEWAAANGVVGGYGNGLFGINDKITVEQACLILQRYAESKNGECNTQLTTARYTDAYKISSYAKEAVNWALANGVYVGTGNRINPLSSASRALVASMFCNYASIFGN